MQTLRQDISYALRQMRLSPVFTLTAMLTLALGIGATTAIFSLIYSVMLKSLPVVDPSSLYRIGAGTDCCVEGGPQDEWGLYSYPLYLRLKTAAPEFEQMAAFQAAGAQFSVRRGVARQYCQAAARRIRQRQLLQHLWYSSIRRTHDHTQRRSSLRPAGSHAQLSRLAATVQFRSFGGGIDLHREWAPLYHRRHRTAWLLR